MSKKVIISLISLIVLLLVIFICVYERDSKFYLDDKYYLSNEFIPVDNLKEIGNDSYICIRMVIFVLFQHHVKIFLNLLWMNIILVL